MTRRDRLCRELYVFSDAVHVDDMTEQELEDIVAPFRQAHARINPDNVIYLKPRAELAGSRR